MNEKMDLPLGFDADGEVITLADLERDRSKITAFKSVNEFGAVVLLTVNIFCPEFTATMKKNVHRQEVQHYVQ